MKKCKFSIVQAQNVGSVYGHSAVVFGMGSHGFKVLVLLGGRRSHSLFVDVLSEMTILLLSKYIEMVVANLKCQHLCSPDERGGSWEVERVVSQAELDRPDPTLTKQMRRLQLSHSTGHTTPSLALCSRESVMSE